MKTNVATVLLIMFVPQCQTIDIQIDKSIKTLYRSFDMVNRQYLYSSILVPLKALFTLQATFTHLHTHTHTERLSLYNFTCSSAVFFLSHNQWMHRWVTWGSMSCPSTLRHKVRRSQESIHWPFDWRLTALIPKLEPLQMRWSPNMSSLYNSMLCKVIIS